MTNTTPTYWSANGESLQTYAKNIETLGGRLKPPPFRGDDITIPYAPGQRWVPKTADSQVISLAMWVRGYNDDNSQPADVNQKFMDNWRALRSLLWNPEKQFALQKRFYVNGVLRSATALAQYESGLEPTMIGRGGAKFVVDLKLADPYFYDDELKTFPLVNGNQTINVLGDVKTRNINITINGSRTNTKIIATLDPVNVQVEYRDVLLSGDVAHLDVMNYSASTDPAATPAFDSTGKVWHTGAPHWLALAPGDTVVNVSSSSGAGTIQLQARGAWI